MPATLPQDFHFEPKVWQDAIAAYFPKKLVFGAVADQSFNLEAEPGTTITFPYFKQIGAAEEPAANESLTVDKIQDDSFTATVKEVGKAVGVRTAARMASAHRRDDIDAEIQRQMARVIAEKIDADILNEINTPGNFATGFQSASNSETATITRVLDGLVTAFGDRQDEVVALFMHSRTWADIMTDSNAGFLKADANDPFWNMPGFMGRLLGRALFISDQCPEAEAVSGKKAFYCFAVKAKPYGFITKQDVLLEADRDILAREDVFAMTQWYAVKAFHAKVSTDDKRIARMKFVTNISA